MLIGNDSHVERGNSSLCDCLASSEKCIVYAKTVSSEKKEVPSSYVLKVLQEFGVEACLEYRKINRK